jgi:hypothetical protein
MTAGEPTPLDPDEPGALLTEPDHEELNGMRDMIRKKLGGTVHGVRHDARYTRIKQAPGKYKSVNVALASCGHDHVLCDIPLDEIPEAKGPLRICLVCDGGRELFDLNGKPL